MKWDILLERMEKAFAHPIDLDVSGKVFLPKRPFRLERALTDCISSAEDLEDLESGGSLEVMEREWPSEPLLDFTWEGAASSVAGLALVRPPGARAWVVSPGATLFSGWTGSPLLAALEPVDRATVSAFVLDFLARNGRRCRVEIFGTFPSAVRNRRPDLVPAGVVRESLRKWSRWARSNLGDGCVTEAVYDDILRALRDPEASPEIHRIANHARLPSGWPSPPHPVHLADWLEDRAWTGKTWGMVLDVYMAARYREEC